MKIQNKFWLGVAGLLLSAGVANAQNADVAAEEESEAILFKVHDISPVKGGIDGEVTSCEFYVTFYNRSKKDIANAQVDLSWMDDSLSDSFSDSSFGECQDDSSFSDSFLSVCSGSFSE